MTTQAHKFKTESEIREREREIIVLTGIGLVYTHTHNIIESMIFGLLFYNLTSNLAE